MVVMFAKENKAIIEALLLVAHEPLTIEKIAEIIQLEQQDVTHLIDELIQVYDAEGRGFRIINIAGGYQLTTRPEHAPYIEQMFQPMASGLSKAALETLAIIAYRQPVTRSEIEVIRGVKAERTLATLTEKSLIEEVGRRDGPGKPILYGTTKEFLQHFGINSLAELPNINDFLDEEKME